MLLFLILCLCFKDETGKVAISESYKNKHKIKNVTDRSTISTTTTRDSRLFVWRVFLLVLNQILQVFVGFERILFAPLGNECMVAT